MDSKRVIEALFGVRRALIGAVHVDALPGTPANRRGVAEIAEDAVRDARVYEAAGFDGVIVENMHDRPYLKAAAGPEVTAAMTAIGVEVRRAVALPLGIQVLAGANQCAVAVAHACGSSCAWRASCSRMWPMRV